MHPVKETINSLKDLLLVFDIDLLDTRYNKGIGTVISYLENIIDSRSKGEFNNDNYSTHDAIRYKNYLNYILILESSLRKLEIDSKSKLNSYGKIKSLIKDILRYVVVEDYRENPGMDKLYELFLGGYFTDAGFIVRFAEPDLIISGNDLIEPLAIACKNLTSSRNINAHIEKGLYQIKKVAKRGILAMDLSNVIASKLFDINELSDKILNFDSFEHIPFDIMDSQISVYRNALKDYHHTLIPKELDSWNIILFTARLTGAFNGKLNTVFHTAIFSVGYKLDNASSIEYRKVSKALQDLNFKYNKSTEFHTYDFGK